MPDDPLPINLAAFQVKLTYEWQSTIVYRGPARVSTGNVMDPSPSGPVFYCRGPYCYEPKRSVWHENTGANDPYLKRGPSGPPAITPGGLLDSHPAVPLKRWEPSAAVRTDDLPKLPSLKLSALPPLLPRREDLDKDPFQPVVHRSKDTRLHTTYPTATGKIHLDVGESEVLARKRGIRLEAGTGVELSELRDASHTPPAIADFLRKYDEPDSKPISGTSKFVDHSASKFVDHSVEEYFKKHDLGEWKPPQVFGLRGPGEARRIGDEVERVRLDFGHSSHPYPHFNTERYQLGDDGLVTSTKKKRILDNHEPLYPQLPKNWWDK